MFIITSQISQLKIKCKDGGSFFLQRSNLQKVGNTKNNFFQLFRFRNF